MSTATSSSVAESRPSAQEDVPLIKAEEGKNGVKKQPGAQVTKSLTQPLSGAENKRLQESYKAEMQRELEKMPQAAVSETHLHEVPWHGVTKEFLLNTVPAILIWAIMSLYVQKLLHMKMKKFVMPVLTVTALTTLVVVAEVLVFFVKSPGGDGWPRRLLLLKASPLLQALLGRKLLKLEKASDVFIFANSLQRKRNQPGAFVDLVVNPAKRESERKMLQLGGEVVPPRRWKVRTFMQEGRDYSEQLDQAASGDLYPTLTKTVSDWILSDSDFKLPCFLELQCSNTGRAFEFLMDHWAIRILLSTVVASIFLMPPYYYMIRMLTLKARYCDLGQTQWIPACLKDPKPCKDACGNVLSFMSEVDDRIKVDEIELIWTVSLGLVTLFVLSLAHVRAVHRVQTQKFLIGMGGVKKEAEAEVVQARRMLDKTLSFAGIIPALVDQFIAYRKQQRACEKLTVDVFNGPSKIQNAAFWEVMKPVRDVRSGEATPYTFSLPAAKEEREAEDCKGQVKDLLPWKDKMQTALEELRAIKNACSLSKKKSEKQRSMKLCVSLPVTCKESLAALNKEFFGKTGPQGYSSQLDAIFGYDNCQDGAPADAGDAGNAHVMEDFRLGSLMVPAGLCLTHVACQAPMMEMITLEIGKGKDIPDRNAFLLLFYGREHADLGGSLVLEKFCAKYHWPTIMLPSAGTANGKEPMDSQDLRNQLKDAYVYEFFFIFQLSPSYFETMDPATDVSLYGFTEGTFARMVDAPAKELPLAATSAASKAAMRKQSWGDHAGSQFCLVVAVQKDDILSKILRLLAYLFSYIGLVAFCYFFVLIVPSWRHFHYGTDFFPEPFTGLLAMNALVQFVGVVTFLWHFNDLCGRLGLIANALETFEGKTLAPVAPHPSEKKDVLAHQNDPAPFDLYIDDVDHCDTDDPKWVKKWQSKELTVENWHLTARYLRVFVSGIRLTAQAMLVAACCVLLVMFLVSTLQAWRGVGAFGLNKENILTDADSAVMTRVNGAIANATAKLQDYEDRVVSHASDALVKKAEDAMSRRLSSASSEDWDFGAPLEALHRALAPMDVAMEHERQRRLMDSASALHMVAKYTSVKDIAKISSAQLLTLCMTLVLLLYCGIVLFRIARINDYVDKHQSLLVSVKEEHLHAQSLRERKATQALAESQKSKKPKKEAEPAESAADIARASYERRLDMCIESAQENKGRFPLKLFSFVITQALLWSWFIIAAQPLIHEVFKVTPPFVAQACAWVDNSTLVTGATSGLEGIRDQAAGLVENAAGQKLTTKTALAVDTHLFTSLVCKPIISVFQRTAMNAVDEVLHHGMPGAPARRRLESVDVKRIVEDWWDAHPGHVATKRALVQMALQERMRRAKRLVLSGPEAVRETLKARGVAAAAEVLRAHREGGERVHHEEL